MELFILSKLANEVNLKIKIINAEIETCMVSDIFKF
ncbi:hypothetical protein Metfor_1410 [Methanoregula formicica SMSP]|uniref:Uncharacterized protein n=1 Tax=Methanoregula formicica (strain DSM 22288 / NBRC 105244 / SMSP) TaxID=593750 RepID=L0HF71_METFS|nr:hypothetical protein Metfor_1410 [Methanoregula formicica SMSP]